MADAQKIIAEQSVVVDIDSVKPYRKNPRVGNLPAIQESLRENGQFRPIVVQKSTGEILGGNHTWKAAKAEGWTEVSVVYVDVDENAAKRIVLADNRTNDLATYNTEILSDILSGLPKPDLGTGYDSDAVTNLLGSIQDKNTEAIADIIRPPLTPLAGLDVQDYGDIGPEGDNSIGGGGIDGPSGGPLGEEVYDPEKDRDKFAEAPGDLPGAFGLKFGEIYEMVGEMHIPPLRPDMLVQPDDVPRDILAWAGSATKDWPNPDQWWLYNFGIDSTSGMHDISKMILSFYAFDHYFENWWDYPDRYTAKMINSGVKMAVTPDFSQWSSEPRVLSLHNLYRNRWLGRYFQEAGIKVIPNISWRYGEKEYFDRYVRATLPKELPVISLQLQTFDKNQTEQELADLKAMIEHVGRECDPQLTIFYVGKQAAAMLEDELDWPGERLIIKNRMEALALQAKGRQKKKTL